MRGKDEQQLDVFSYVSAEQRIPQDHPLRPLRAMADEALHQLQSRFRRLYAKNGRPSIAPEKLLRALLLQVLYSVRSERMLMEQLDYNLLFRWFVGLNMDDGIWDATVFTKNRQRLLAGDIADAFFAAVLRQARQRNLLSDEHFTVDGTLLEAWAGQKSFRRVDDDHQPPAAVAAEYSNPTVNFHGEKRSNQTHCSTTDPDAMLARKSRGTGQAKDKVTTIRSNSGQWAALVPRVAQFPRQLLRPSCKCKVEIVSYAAVSSAVLRNLYRQHKGRKLVLAVRAVCTVCTASCPRSNPERIVAIFTVTFEPLFQRVSMHLLCLQHEY
jgi:transposase